MKLLDFGISKSANAPSSKALTATSAIMGRPLYMSPEQLREARNVDGRADVWALGVVMYERRRTSSWRRSRALGRRSSSGQRCFVPDNGGNDTYTYVQPTTFEIDSSGTTAEVTINATLVFPDGEQCHFEEKSTYTKQR